MGGAIRDVTASEFDGLLSEHDAVLVDFWAQWCGPCKMMGPVLETIAGQFAGRVTVVKVDTDSQQELAARYTVMSLPTLILFKNSEQAARFSGYMPAEDLAGKLEQNL